MYNKLINVHIKKEIEKITNLRRIVYWGNLQLE
jgi:hypothetical protein